MIIASINAPSGILYKVFVVETAVLVNVKNPMESFDLKSIKLTHSNSGYLLGF